MLVYYVSSTVFKATTAEHTMIKINNLSFGYNQSSNLFNNLSLSLEQGGICGLLGKNGSGKTSLLKVIAGLIFPSQGSCQVMGMAPQQRRPSFLQELYFLPEDIYAPPLTADDYVKFYAPFYPKFDQTLLQNCLQEFDLPRDKPLSNLSHGQKKKFLIAFGLATHCKLFILDEPSNGLDIPSKAQFRKLLASTISDERLFIISTHQVHDVENLIDTVVILDEGKIILQQKLFEIAKRLAIVQQQTEPNLNTCLYYEKHLAGYTVVTVNTNNQDTHMDLEILFNAILANKIRIQQIFTRD